MTLVRRADRVFVVMDNQNDVVVKDGEGYVEGDEHRLSAVVP
jgi:hypothetical protein